MLQPLYPHRNIQLVQNDAPSHGKTRNIHETLGISDRIYYLIRPPNSPDLHLIKETFSVSKTYWDSTHPTTSYSHVGYEQVSRLIITTLQIGRALDSQIRKYTTVERFRKKSIQCLKHSGNNNQHGQLKHHKTIYIRLSYTNLLLHDQYYFRKHFQTGSARTLSQVLSLVNLVRTHSQWGNEHKGVDVDRHQLRIAVPFRSISS